MSKDRGGLASEDVDERADAWGVVIGIVAMVLMIGVIIIWS